MKELISGIVFVIIWVGALIYFTYEDPDEYLS